MLNDALILDDHLLCAWIVQPRFVSGGNLLFGKPLREAATIGLAVPRCGRFSLFGGLLLVAILAGNAWSAEPGRPAPATPALSFSRDVIPVLTKSGCNAGACHGSFQGRGGLILSLWGFDPEVDYRALVTNARGRRVFTAAPDRSLMLRKPVMAVPHGGGKRLSLDSEAYAILRNWIAQGATPPSAGDPRVVRIEVQPPELLLTRGQQALVKVTAVWSDGLQQDATRWSLFETSSEPVAAVSAEGMVTAGDSGRAAITVRFQGQVHSVPVTVPYGQATPPAGIAGSSHPIDRFVAAEWQKLGLEPAPLCTDAEFLRRASIDLIGSLPTTDEVRKFLNSTDPDRRTKLIDELLARPEYADYWSIKWSDLLRAHRRVLGDKGLASFSGWLKQALRENRPLDAVVRELLTAQGNLYSSGPVAFYLVNTTPQDLAESTAQIFLGIRIQCARCHHHPFEVWGQDDYYGLSAFFSRVQRKDTREAGRFGGAQSVKLAAEGSLTNPDTGLVVPPHLFDRATAVEASPDDLRKRLAEWITARDNPYFARNIVNRYWGYLFGRGLVEPIDDLRATNPASHPALFDMLARDFVSHGYDVRHLLKTICTSQTYQLAAEISPERDIDGMFFTHRIPRRLPAEVLLDAINQASGTVETFESFPPGTRAIALPDPAVPSKFLETFGRPLRVTTCECERPSKPDLRQVLHLLNSEAVHKKACADQGRVGRLIAAGKTDGEIVEDLYLATLSRPPLPDEVETCQRLIASAPSRADGLHDLLWTLINVTEFSFNH